MLKNQPTGVTRRSVVHSAAWALPVIAAAVAVPAAAASQDPVHTCGGTYGDNGVFTVQDRTLTISYRTAPDIYEINARGVGWSQSYGTNYGTAPAKGSRTWSILLPEKPTWIQIHGFNSHFGEVC